MCRHDHGKGQGKHKPTSCAADSVESYSHRNKQSESLGKIFQYDRSSLLVLSTDLGRYKVKIDALSQGHKTVFTSFCLGTLDFSCKERQEKKKHGVLIPYERRIFLNRYSQTSTNKHIKCSTFRNVLNLAPIRLHQ